MSTITVLSEADVQRIAEPILAQRFLRYGFHGLTVRIERDFDGEPIFKMVADVTERVPARDIIDAMDAVRQRQLEDGEERLVFLSIRADVDEGAEMRDVD